MGLTRDDLVPILKRDYPDFTGGPSTIARLMEHWYPPVIPWRWEMRNGKPVKVTDLSPRAVKALIDHREELVRGRLRARTEKKHTKASREVLLHAIGRDSSAWYHEVIQEEAVGRYGRVEKRR